jgi:NADP-dependent 3-hydroxy acid dehydrogenase YdfG
MSGMGFGSAIVTGAGTGIGAAIARMLGRAGVPVTLVGRRAGAVTDTAAEIVAAAGVAHALSADVRSFEDMEMVVRQATGRHGPVDLLVANAAIAEVGAIADADPHLYQDVITTNVVGVMNVIRAALPVMLERRAGHVVVIASVSGRVTYTGESAYVASKHATVAFADCLRQEVAPAGVRVSVIEPGLVETPLIHVYPGALDMVPDVTPLAPDDVARAVRFVLEQPANVNIAEVVLRPTSQIL